MVESVYLNCDKRIFAKKNYYDLVNGAGFKENYLKEV